MMKVGRLGTFSLGVITTAVSLGTVSYVSAAGDQTLNACANKKSGVMRYISKGSCKKTEIKLSWNQMGSQGPVGATGPSGVDGQTGPAGTSGINGQNFYVVDADGKVMGPLISYIPAETPGTTGFTSSVAFQKDGFIWSANTSSFEFFGTGGDTTLYFATNSLPRKPFGRTGLNLSGQETWTYQNKTYKAVGNPMTFSSLDVYQSNGLPLSVSDKQNYDLSGARLVNLEEIQAPTYLPPLKIVQK